MPVVPKQFGAPYMSIVLVGFALWVKSHAHGLDTHRLCPHQCCVYLCVQEIRTFVSPPYCFY